MKRRRPFLPRHPAADRTPIREDALTADDIAGIHKVGRNWLEHYPAHGGEPTRAQFVEAFRLWAFHVDVVLVERT
jgi:hypothetical protein